MTLLSPTPREREALSGFSMRNKPDREDADLGFGGGPVLAQVIKPAQEQIIPVQNCG